MTPKQTWLIIFATIAITVVIYFEPENSAATSKHIRLKYPRPLIIVKEKEQSSRQIVENILVKQKTQEESHVNLIEATEKPAISQETADTQKTVTEPAETQKPASKPATELKATTELDCTVHEGKPKQFQYVPLLSWPGSGNTWLRFLIEQATGWQTTTVEKGDKKLAPFFVGEYDYPLSGKSIVQKTHYFTYVRSWFKEIDTYKMAHSCVLLIRSPIDAFLAEFQRRETGANHTGFIKPEKFYTQYRSRFQALAHKWITNQVNSYSNTYLDPIKKSCDKAYHVIFYDELKENTFEEIQKLVLFLEEQHKVPMKLRIGCLNKDNKGHAKRKKQEFDKDKVKGMLSTYLKNELNKGLDRLNETLEGRVPGYYKV